ncbi:MAG: ECF transporter S component [Bifidobacteriaceae bacterium]|jgi:uncharacterized membrane protein|nr:ECF transporter S component [Bifidobacteriaceae bacterium]
MSLRRISINASLIAFSVVLGTLVIIPIPGAFGVVTAADIGILAGALILGPFEGALIGAVSGALIDVFTGYLQWMPFSLTIHAAEGFVAGLIGVLAVRKLDTVKEEEVSAEIIEMSADKDMQGKVRGNRINWLFTILALSAGLLVMVAGYFLVTWWIYGIGAAVISIPANIGQSALGAVGAVIILRVSTRFREI